MLKFTSIVGYTSCGPTYIESFLTIFGQCINVLNYNYSYTLLGYYFYGHDVVGFQHVSKSHDIFHTICDTAKTVVLWFDLHEAIHAISLSQALISKSV